MYGLVWRAGVHRVPVIRTAEAAKVIENVQRDLNIALINELAEMVMGIVGVRLKIKHVPGPQAVMGSNSDNRLI